MVSAPGHGSMKVNGVETVEFVWIPNDVDVLDPPRPIEGERERCGRLALELDQGSVHAIQIYQIPLMAGPIAAEVGNHEVA